MSCVGFFWPFFVWCLFIYYLAELVTLFGHVASVDHDMDRGRQGNAAAAALAAAGGARRLHIKRAAAEGGGGGG